MKYIILLVLVLSVLLSGCGYSGTFSSEASEVCISYCSERGMSYDSGNTIIWKNSIECACNAPPIMRGEPETRNAEIVMS